MSTYFNRREFIKTAAATASLAVSGQALAAEVKAGSVPRRPFRDEVTLPIIGFPGLCLNNLPSAEEANKVVARAFAEGIDYFDVAPAYGKAEVLLGPALEPYRKKCFLACKTKSRTAEGAKAEMQRSMERLKTDHFEMYQLHCLVDPVKDVDAAFAKGGVMEYLEECKKAGRIRYIGFSAHTIEAATAALDRYPFDSMMLPVNFASFHKGEFGPTAVRLAKEKETRIIAIKAFVKQTWPKDAPNRKEYARLWYQPLSDPHEQQLGVRFSLSQGITSAIPPADQRFVWSGIEIARNFKPLDEQEAKEVAALAESLDPLFKKGKIIS